jgi:hypothetical protein
MKKLPIKRRRECNFSCFLLSDALFLLLLVVAEDEGCWFIVAYDHSRLSKPIHCNCCHEVGE